MNDGQKLNVSLYTICIVAGSELAVLIRFSAHYMVVSERYAMAQFPMIGSDILGASPFQIGFYN